MHPLSVFVSLLLVLNQGRPVTAMPNPADSGHEHDIGIHENLSTCKKFIVRKEWRSLAWHEKLDFISAVKCLQVIPGKTSHINPGVKSRYDDYQALHIRETGHIHFVGQFQPWHRRYIALFEADLRTSCGYKGGLPYWDWTLDATSEANILKSPVFDPIFGFGGNGIYIANLSSFPPESLSRRDTPGRTGGGCVTTGPFATRKVSLGPGNHTEYTPHCLRRDFSPYIMTRTLNAGVRNRVLSQPDHFHFDLLTLGASLAFGDMTGHAGGHAGVGGKTGDVGNLYSSPGDPLFWLHHAMLDYTWDKWQKKNWPARKFDIAGPDTMYGYPYQAFSTEVVPYKNVTLDFELAFPNMASTVKIRDVMDIQGGLLCYKYYK